MGNMNKDKQSVEDIDCYECGAQFTLKYSFEQEPPVYCPFCGADLPLNAEEEEDGYDEEEDYDEDDY